MSAKKPRIVQAADAVAYLPLYAAEKHRYRLERPTGGALAWSEAFGDPWRSPPQEFVSHVNGDLKKSGDLGCLNAIVEAWEREELPLIGICDPIDVALTHGSALVIVGAFINRACFWCLTDGHTHATDLGGLAVDAMFIHDSSFATGHSIGLNILNAIPRGRHGPPEHFDASFDLLVDGAVWWKEQNPGGRVAAVTASILSCVLAEQRKGFRVAFPIYDLDRYDRFLTTAIVVHRKALREEHVREALTLLILALREGRQQVAMADAVIDDLVALSASRFEDERRIDCAQVSKGKVVGNGCNATEIVRQEHARQVLEMLRQRPIYSEDCRVRQQEWSNAFATRGLQVPPLAHSYDESIVAGCEGRRLAKGPPPRDERPPRSPAATPWVAILLTMAGFTCYLGSAPAIVTTALYLAALAALVWPVAARRGLSLPRVGAVVKILLGLFFLIMVLVAVLAGFNSEGGQVNPLPEAFPEFIRALWASWAPRVLTAFDAVEFLLGPITWGVLGLVAITVSRSWSAIRSRLRSMVGRGSQG
jgi:hypothetical protein